MRTVTVQELTAQDREDLEIGRNIRRLEGDIVGTAHLACLLLIGQAVRLGAGKSEYTEASVTIKGKPEGDWKITVEDVSKADVSEEEDQGDETTG